MKKQNFKLLLNFKVLFILSFLWIFSSCDVLDPTDISNPNSTDEDLRNNSNGSTVVFLNGLIELCGDAIESSAIFTEALSDNYDNTGGERRPHIDFPSEISPEPEKLDVGPYEQLHEIISLATFMIDDVIPNDKKATAEQLEETYFYRGLAYLILSELYVGSPLSPNGSFISPNDINAKAIADFTKSEETTTNNELLNRIYILKARAYRITDNKTKAMEYAQLAITNGGNDFNFVSQHDETKNANTFVSLASWQPNPRLDFLDPKYIDLNAGISIAKIEEAYLIKAEVELANDNQAGAKQTLKDLIGIVETRPKRTFNDEDLRPDDIVRNFGGKRPQFGKVKFDSNSPEISNLILARSGNEVTIPNISGTHLTANDIDNITTKANLFYTIYLLRQEIFFAEGRRITDLGIRLPVSARQLETNDNLSFGSNASKVNVPNYIPPQDEMDHFTIKDSVVTIKWDVNKILTEHSEVVSPFEISL